MFGTAAKEPPRTPTGVQAKRLNDFDMEVSFSAPDAVGCNILWGHAENKLYHSCMVFGEDSHEIRALVKGQNCFVRIDAFNEGGITKGATIAVENK